MANTSSAVATCRDVPWDRRSALSLSWRLQTLLDSPRPEYQGELAQGTNNNIQIVAHLIGNRPDNPRLVLRREILPLAIRRNDAAVVVIGAIKASRI